MSDTDQLTDMGGTPMLQQLEVDEDQGILDRLTAELNAERQKLDDYVRLANLARDFAAFAQTEERCPRCELVAKWSVLKNWFLQEQLQALRKQATITNIADPVNQEAWIRLSERAAVFGVMATEPQRVGGVDRATMIAEQGKKKAGLVNQLWAAVLELTAKIAKRNS